MRGAACGLRERMRAATARAHRGLERDLDWEARTRTLPGYRNLLAGLHGFHAAYEPAIGRALGDEAFLGPRRRLAALEADLAGLGLDPAAIAALPRPRGIPLAGPAAALGALYVLEGSTLGGAVIGRSIAQRHGAAVACTYYRGRGRATAAMWAAFCERLESACAAPAAQAAALAAGTATFEALRDWLVVEAAGAAA